MVPAISLENECLFLIVFVGFIFSNVEINYKLKVFKKTLLHCKFNLTIPISMIMDFSLFKIIP
tara:strand:- start:831 stop:1019 length:189 start_codon:yes stop_codon:yes gene_type:complete